MKKNRNSTIELLRVFCMFMLILHHMCVHGDLLNITNGINKKIVLFFIPFGKIAFCCFLAISMFYLTEQTFRMKKFISTWLLVFFYNIVFTIIAMSIVKTFFVKSFFASFFPILGNSHGFASAYLAFYLMLPFLHIVSSKISTMQLQYLVIILVVFQCGSKIMGGITDYYQNLGSELSLFVFCYFFQLYLKKRDLRILKSKGCLILIIVITYLLRLGIDIFRPQKTLFKILYNISLSVVGDESGILNIMAGFALFYLFKGLKETNIPFVNLVASATFPVLLIHDHNVLRPIIWNNIFDVQRYSQSNILLIRMLLIAFIIYIVGFVIEIIRKNISNKFILNNKKIIGWTERIDRKLNDR